MQDIHCPECKKAFKIDEAGYADIVKQVRDSEFTQQLNERLDIAEKEKINAVELAKQQATNDAQKKSAAKDAEIQDLKARLEAGDTSKQLAVSEAVKAVEKERDDLANRLRQAELEKKPRQSWQRQITPISYKKHLRRKTKRFNTLKQYLARKKVKKQCQKYP